MSVPPAAKRRLTREYKQVQEQPIPCILAARPLEDNILQCHYLLQGPENSPYSGGLYWGVLVFPKEYPFKPPQIKMLTPNGRFAVNESLCLSISNFHPDTWNPAWNVGTILTGLVSFMMDNETTTGSITTTDLDKKVFAKKSLEYNKTQAKFKDIFPDFLDYKPPEKDPNTKQQTQRKTINASEETKPIFSVLKKLRFRSLSVIMLFIGVVIVWISIKW